ncbi:hypothetical protein J6590_015070 [Homalodisca vitripennis]|nr:hypothetical protein J6590_015070 [Homalodisca vitripennis]
MKGRRGKRDGVVLPSKGGNFQKLLHLHRMVKSSKEQKKIFYLFRLSSGVSDLTVKTDLAV